MEGSEEVLLDMNNEDDFKTRMKDLNKAAKLQLEDIKQLVLVEMISDHFMMNPDQPLKITHKEDTPFGAVGEFFKGQTLDVTHEEGQMILSKEFEKK